MKNFSDTKTVLSIKYSLYKEKSVSLDQLDHPNSQKIQFLAAKRKVLQFNEVLWKCSPLSAADTISRKFLPLSFPLQMSAMSSVFLQCLYMDKKTRTDQSEELGSKTSLLYGPSSAFEDLFGSSFKGLKTTEQEQENTDDSSNWDHLNIWRSHLVCRAAAPSQKILPEPINLSLVVQLTGEFMVLQIFLLWPPQALNCCSQPNTPAPSWMFTKEFDPEAKPSRPAMKLWGWWVVSCSNNTVMMRTTCTGSASKRSWRCGFIRFLVVFYRSHAGTKGDLKHCWSLTCEKRALAFIHRSKSGTQQ